MKKFTIRFYINGISIGTPITIEGLTLDYAVSRFLKESPSFIIIKPSDLVNIEVRVE